MKTDGPRGEIVIYQAPDGGVEMEVRLEKETIWLNLNQIAVLFDRDKSVISRHLNKVFKDGELERKSVVAKYATTAADGKTHSTPSAFEKFSHFLRQPKILMIWICLV